MSDASGGGIAIRPGTAPDLPELNALYNHFVAETPATFDITPITLEARKRWFHAFADRGPHRIFVATRGGRFSGFACSREFRAKEAYATSVETTVYLAPDAVGQGIGTRLYEALFDALAGEDVHRAYAGITLPNDGSIALHRKLEFREIGTYREVGRKFGRYWSVQWFEKALDAAPWRRGPARPTGS